MSFRSSSFALHIAEYKKFIPEIPILDNVHMALAFNQIGLLQDQISIARAQGEQVSGNVEENSAASRLLMLELQLGHAAAYAYKMMAIKSLSLAKEQSDLFAVDTYVQAWRRAEHIIKAVNAEIGVRDALARGH